MKFSVYIAVPRAGEIVTVLAPPKTHRTTIDEAVGSYSAPVRAARDLDLDDLEVPGDDDRLKVFACKR